MYVNTRSYVASFHQTARIIARVYLIDKKKILPIVANAGTSIGSYAILTSAVTY